MIEPHSSDDHGAAFLSFSAIWTIS